MLDQGADAELESLTQQEEHKPDCEKSSAERFGEMRISGLVDDAEQRSTSLRECVELSLLVREEAENGLHICVGNIDGRRRQRSERVQQGGRISCGGDIGSFGSRRCDWDGI
jgi:hypothetical protein